MLNQESLLKNKKITIKSVSIVFQIYTNQPNHKNQYFPSTNFQMCNYVYKILLIQFLHN